MITMLLDYISTYLNTKVLVIIILFQLRSPAKYNLLDLSEA